ncbi:PKD domain-containing protein [Candidatus Bathyarchaeota archaeon]|nr:MAG: PKD domain-containing protein [Candidatus Bathyarchaeota archaeon]
MPQQSQQTSPRHQLGGTTPYTYAWTFGDGGTSNVANPTHAYAAAGTFTVTLTITDSSTPTQTATATHTVTVSAGLAANFTSSPAHPIIGGTVTFTSTVTGGATPYVYSWTFGDGGTSTVANPTHAYATSGNFTVTLRVTDSSTPALSATATHFVIVASAVTANFTSSPASPTTGQTVTFTSTVSGGTTPYSYSWTFGDGGTSNVANPTHAYTTPGTFTVTLTVTDSSTPTQSATATHTVTVSAKLAADFTFSPTTPTVGQTVTFTSTVTGGVTPYTYSWTFGDGGTSAVANPTHAYASAGSFTVTLTVTDTSIPAQTATASHVVTTAGATFSIAANPTSVGPLVPANASDGMGGTNAAPNATSTIIVTGSNGFTGTVILSLTPASGLNAFLNVTSITLSPTKTSGGALLTVNSNTPGNYLVTITGTSGGVSKTATVSVTVVDFNVGASPLTIGPLRPNQTGSTTVTVTGLNGITTMVAVSRIPGGTTSSLTLSNCSLSPTTTTCTGTLTASADVAGVYQIIVDAISNVAESNGNLGANTVTVDHQIVVTVTVQDFAISASPSTIGPQSPGVTGTSTITVTALQGFTGTVSFVLTASSTHVTASIAPTSVTFTSSGPTSLTATLSVSFDQLGTYAVLVNGSSTGYPSHSVRVHVISPATVLITPQSQGLASPGSTVSYSVSVVSMPTFAGYDISVQTNNAVLSPNSIDTSATIIPGFFETINCVNGGFYANGTAIPSGMPGNLNCGSTDGPGVVHSAGSSTSGFASGDGLLFTINYIARAADFSISASPTVVSNLGAGQTGTSTITISTVTPSSTTVTVFNNVIMDTNGGSIAHSTQSGTYGVSSFTVSLSLTPSSGLVANIVPTSVTLSLATPTVTATLSFSAATAGNYTVRVTGSATGLPNTPSHNAMVNVQVTDFALSASPSTISPPSGTTSGNSTITVSGLNGFTGTVSLSAAASSGLTATLSTSTISLSSTTTSGTSLLSVSQSQCASGTYMVIVTGSSPNFQSRTTKVTVIISCGNDFKITASPNFFTGYTQNGKNKFTSIISVTSVGGFSGTVNLSATSSPNSKVSLSFSTTSVNVPSGGQATASLFITIGPHAQTGTYSITVTGTSGTTSHSVTITVIIPNKTILITGMTWSDPLSVSGSNGAQTWLVTVQNFGSSTQYVQVVISGVANVGDHAFTAQSSVVAVAAGASMTITVSTPSGTFTSANVGQTFSFQTVAFFGTTSTTLNNVSQPDSGQFTVVA